MDIDDEAVESAFFFIISNCLHLCSWTVDRGRIEASLGREDRLFSQSHFNSGAVASGRLCKLLERRAGIEPANTGFADLRVDRFATGASWNSRNGKKAFNHRLFSENEKPTAPSGGWVVGVRYSCFGI